MTLRGRAMHALLRKFSPGASLQSQMLPPDPGDLVFLGDGLSTHGAWAEWFPTTRVRTLGDEALLISEATAFIEKLDRPRALVILVGTADLLGFAGSTDPNRAASRLDTIVARAAGRLDPATIFVVGVPSRPALGTRSVIFNRIVERSVAARGATFIPAPPIKSDESDGFALESLRWDAPVYLAIAGSLSAAMRIEGSSGRLASTVASSGGGFVDKMARKSVELFETLPTPRGRVVLFGDSITAGGFWDAWLPDLQVANRGIGGDTVAQLSARIDTAIDSPRLVSVLAGTNDLLRGDLPKDPDAIAGRFSSLISSIRERESAVPIVINSVMPRAAKYSSTIEAINAHYRAIAREFDAHYLDLWPTLATPKKTLRKEFTPDGLHLNAEGYRAWVGVLRPTIQELLDERGTS